MTSSPKQRLAVIATEKITKKQIDQTLAEGKTHVKFKSNKVQRRLLKEQERIRRLREVRENKFKAAQKAAANARQTTQGGGIGLAHPVADRDTVKVIEESAYFINKEGKRVPVPSDEAKEIAKAFEAEEEEDLTDHQINPFESESDSRTQMFSPGLTDQITQDGKDNVEAMRQALFDAGLVQDNNDQKT